MFQTPPDSQQNQKIPFSFDQELTQEQALHLYPKTGILILLSPPKQIELGIDNISWRICDRFKGFKLIPVGPHYIHYALKDENYQYRLGFFIQSTAGQVIIKEWSEDTSTFIDVQDTDKINTYISCAKNLELDGYLAPYPNNKYHLWNDSSNYINQAI